MTTSDVPEAIADDVAQLRRRVQELEELIQTIACPERSLPDTVPDYAGFGILRCRAVRMARALLERRTQ